ncbi:uncharacterized protein LOC112682531 [Sipha flava]|uniref:Uncharacterized protein LOC112682531 n=1 Tax=Sipha flava TaxID=143950 RepID=A0A8B8FED6_9HEMI|nr:uncharacterized protein LOC112682531 [Sipha flava]
MLINALTMPTYLLTMKERRLQKRWIQRQRNQVMKQKPPNVIEIEKEFTGNQPKIKLNISYYVAGYLTLLYWKLEKDPEKLLGYEIDIDDVSLIKSVWKSNKPLIVVTHGWIDYYDESGVYSIKNRKYCDQ